MKHIHSTFLILLAGFCIWMVPLEGEVRHLYLTWQRDPCHTITLNVHGVKTPETLHVYYDTEPRLSLAEYAYHATGKGSVQTQLSDKRRLYHIELTQLEPGTPYYFTLSDGKEVLGIEQSFCTIPEEGEPLLFVEGGDWENTPEAESLAKKAASLSPRAVWLGGDYPSRVFGVGDFKRWDEWLDVYTHSMVTPEGHLIPMVMAIGNHEVIGGYDQPKTQVPFFFRYFKQGEESYFTLPFGKQVQLFVLDSGHTAPHGGKQAEWLQEELQKAAQIPIKAALYHVPLFPSVRFAEQDLAYHTFSGIVKRLKGAHSAAKLYSKGSHLGRRHWLPLFDHYGLTVAFEHHDQALKRTKRLRKGHKDPNGTLYLGDGGWGSKVQYPPIQGYFQHYFAQLKGKEHFFWVVEIEKNQITYTALTASGRTLDRASFSIEGQPVK